VRWPLNSLEEIPSEFVSGSLTICIVTFSLTKMYLVTVSLYLQRKDKNYDLRLRDARLAFLIRLHPDSNLTSIVQKDWTNNVQICTSLVYVLYVVYSIIEMDLLASESVRSRDTYFGFSPLILWYILKFHMYTQRK